MLVVPRYHVHFFLAPADDQILLKIVNNRHRYTDGSLGNFISRGTCLVYLQIYLHLLGLKFLFDNCCMPESDLMSLSKAMVRSPCERVYQNANLHTHAHTRLLSTAQ